MRKVGVLAEISFKAKADALNRKIGFEGLSLVRSNAGSRLRIRRRLLSEQKTNNGQHNPDPDLERESRIQSYLSKKMLISLHAARLVEEQPD